MLTDKFVLTALLAVTAVAAASPGWTAGGSALSDEPRPMQVDSVPQRVPPLLEVGDTFLGPGNIGAGFELPTGAVWQPNLIVWGQFRSAINHVDDEARTGDDYLSEWANRLDLFGQLSLSQTDRIVLGVRSFDEDLEFMGYRFNPEEEWVDPTLDISIAFLELNFAELFPGTKSEQRRWTDIDFSVGRQPMLFQEGVIVSDNMDSVALSRNNLMILPGANNTRASLVYAWNEVNRSDNRADDEAEFYGVFTETDLPLSTINVDIVWVESDLTGDGFYAGISAIQRLGKFNTAVRVVHSEPTNGSTELTTRGTVVLGELSWSPAGSADNIYINAFGAFDEYRPASRDIATGGPLGVIGILYAAVGLGGYSAPLANDAIEAWGGALGYQVFFANNRRQLILEFGGREDTDDSERREFAVGARYQHALGRRFVARIEGYLADRENFDNGWGARTELLIKF